MYVPALLYVCFASEHDLYSHDTSALSSPKSHVMLETSQSVCILTVTSSPILATCVGCDGIASETVVACLLTEICVSRANVFVYHFFVVTAVSYTHLTLPTIA